MLRRRVSISVLAATLALPGAAISQPAPVNPVVPIAQPASSIQPTSIGQPTVVSATAALPENTVGVLLFNSSPEIWGQLNRFNPYTEYLTSPFLAPAWEVVNEIQAWLGGPLAIALLPAPAADQSPTGVMVVPVKDSDRAAAFLQKIIGSQTPTTERTYKGIKISEWDLSPAKPSVEPESETEPESKPSSESEGPNTIAPAPNVSPRPGVPDSTGPNPNEVLPPLKPPSSPQSKSLPQAIAPASQPQSTDAPSAIAQSRSQRKPVRRLPRTNRAPRPMPRSVPRAPARPMPQPTPSAPAVPPEAFPDSPANGSNRSPAGSSDVLVPTPPPASAPNPFALKRIALAQMPGYLVLAPEGTTIERIIEAQTQPRLNDNPLFQRTLKHPQFGRSLLVGYGNMAELVKLLTPLLKSLPMPPEITPDESGPESLRLRSRLAAKPQTPPATLPPSQREQMQKQIEQLEKQLARVAEIYNSFEVLTWVQPEGIRSQSSFYFTTPRPDWVTDTPPNPNQILTRLPAATYLSANSRNFKRQWEIFLKEVAQVPNPEFNTLLKTVRDGVRQGVGLDLDKDLIGWMDGEYVVFFYPTRGGFLNEVFPNLGLGMGLMVQTSDRASAEAALKKIDQRIVDFSKGEVAIVPRRLVNNAPPITSWESKDFRTKKAVSFFSYGWVNDDTLIVTAGAGAMDTLYPKPYLPLHLNYTFQTATTSFPLPNEGYFFLNMGSSLAFLYPLVMPYVPSDPMSVGIAQEVQRVLGTIRSISATNTVTLERYQGDVLYVLGEPQKKPNPTPVPTPSP